MATVWSTRTPVVLVALSEELMLEQGKLTHSPVTDVHSQAVSEMRVG